MLAVIIQRYASLGGGAAAPAPGMPQQAGFKLGWPHALLAFLTLALFLRFGILGNPDYHVDEEFYFVVADQMWRGALPYVDIWDRKPIGLFLIYAALRPFSGDTLIATQIAGHCFTAGTALVIWDCTRRRVGDWRALLPAALYVSWVEPFGGANGQAPVFHNLMVAGAFWLLAREWRRSQTHDPFWAGVGAMLLIGLAIQIKYTPLFPGIAFGLALMFLEWRRSQNLSQLVARALIWCGCALLPTAVVMLFYIRAGHLEEFWHANFVSIFLRGRLDHDFLQLLKQYMLMRGLPLYGLAIFALWKMVQDPDREGLDFLLIAWLFAELVGLVFVGNYYDHYLLPVLVPLTAICYRAYDLKPFLALPVYLSVLISGSDFNLAENVSRTHRASTTISTLTTRIKPYLDHGCLFVFDGPSVLYATTESCLLTKFVYPDHLSNAVESPALNVDSHREIEGVLSSRPSVIVTSSRMIIPVSNKVNQSLVMRTIENGYRLVAYGPDAYNYRYYLAWARKDLIRSKDQILPPPPVIPRQND